MKVLFLDVDGVLNNSHTRVSPDGFFGTDPHMVLLLDRIIQATKCQVVLSSAWRHHKPSMAYIGKMIHGGLLSKTGDAENGHRGREIQDWLDEWNDLATDKVERYAIVDDDSDMLEEQLPSFFQTKWETGLTEETAERIIKHLSD